MGVWRMSEIEVVWEAPPARRPQSKYAEAMEQVKTRPGQWARIASFRSQGSGYSARKSLIKLFAADDPKWEIALSRLDADGVFGLYVRYRNDGQMKAAAEDG